MAQRGQGSGELVGDQMAITLPPVNLLHQLHLFSLKAEYAKYPDSTSASPLTQLGTFQPLMTAPHPNRSLSRCRTAMTKNTAPVTVI